MMGWLFPVAVILCFGGWLLSVGGQYQWYKRDGYDEIREKMDRVTPENCHVKFAEELKLPEGTVTHIPDIKLLEANPIFPNRTALLHLHSMALSRSFFFSFILQKAWDDHEPGLMYFFLSTVADVSANPRINASAIYFAPNMSYTPSYKGFFNKTMPLFAPRSFRADDFNDPFHLQRLSTLNTIESNDLGSFRRDQRSLNYTHDDYRINQWYTDWLPDRTTRQDSKATYYVQITYANNTNETFVWHGPPGGEEIPGPIKWSRPYYDCGRSNKWSVSATVPIPDIYPRHTGFRHIEYPRYGAVAVMEMDFERIDINQCPYGPGNIERNQFAATDRCKNDTTECEPLEGFGFRRGGYQCRCKPGYRLPFVVRKPYLGDVIERASLSEYNHAFSCQKIGWIMQLPQKFTKADPQTRRKYLSQFNYEDPKMFYQNHYPYSGSGYSQPPPNKDDMNHFVRSNINEFVRYFRTNVTEKNCQERPLDLELPGDTTFGIEKQLENEARMGLRLASFLSAFLQIVDTNEQFGELRLADKPLTEDQMFGEVIATVMGDVRLWAAGIFWDRNQFTNRTYFAPFAYKKQVNTRRFHAEDLTRRKKSQPEKFYTKQPWFRTMKTRWGTNTDDLEEYILKIKIRGNSSGEYLTRYDHFPVRYKAANIGHGHWTAPYFDCGLLNKWVVSYVAPFFGWDSIKHKLQFKGVVMTTVLLEKLDLNQCNEPYSTPNAFKGTNKCDARSSICIPMLGRGFDVGGYKCECEQGYEYPFDNAFTYFDGQLLENEFENLIINQESRFDLLRCRVAGAETITASIIVVLALIVAVFVHNL